MGCRVDQYACGTRVPTTLTSTLLSQNPQCPIARSDGPGLPSRSWGMNQRLRAFSRMKYHAASPSDVHRVPLPVHGFWLSRPILSGAAKQTARPSGITSNHSRHKPSAYMLRENASGPSYGHGEHRSVKRSNIYRSARLDIVQIWMRTGATTGVISDSAGVAA